MTRTIRQYQGTRLDVRLLLCGLWVATLLVFAYVDILGFYRADVLDAALGGTVATTSFTVNQTFLTLTLLYVLLPTVMVVLSLLLRPRVNRVVNVVISLLYMLSVIVSCIGEEWFYYILGSSIEVVFLAAIARLAWTWPPPESPPTPGSAVT